MSTCIKKNNFIINLFKTGFVAKSVNHKIQFISFLVSLVLNRSLHSAGKLLVLFYNYLFYMCWPFYPRNI